MFARNLSKKMQHFMSTDENYKKVLDIFIKNKEKEMSIIYFLQETKIPKDKLYDIFHDLLDSNIIGYNEYTRCPNCMNMRKINFRSNMSNCKSCRITYFNDYNIEKFYLKDN